RLPICQLEAGGKEVRHRLLLARLGLKPDEQPTFDHHFCSARWLLSAPKRAEPYERSRFECIGRIANFCTGFSMSALARDCGGSLRKTLVTAQGLSRPVSAAAQSRSAVARQARPSAGSVGPRAPAWPQPAHDLVRAAPQGRRPQQDIK